MSGDVVQAAKEALEGVTEGPWAATEDEDYFDGYGVGVVVDRSNLGGYWTVCDGFFEKRDAPFVAAARSLIPELVAEVERLRNEVNRLEYESVPEIGVEHYLSLRYADDPIEAFNLFIQSWVPEHFHAHLLDTDENAGEFVRQHIRRAVAGDA